MLEQASLFRSGVPLDSRLEGHSLWDLALVMPGLARSYLIPCEILAANDPPCCRAIQRPGHDSPQDMVIEVCS